MNNLINKILKPEVIGLACSLKGYVRYMLMQLAAEVALAQVEYYEVDHATNFAHAINVDLKSLLNLIALYISVLNVYGQSSPMQFRATMGEIGFTEEVITEVLKSQPVSLMLSGNYGGIQKLSSFKCRVDISLTCGITRNMTPTQVVISLKYKNGNRFIYQIEPNAFKRLRFSISLACKEFLHFKSLLNNKPLV